MDDSSFNIRVPKRWARVAMIVTVTALVVAPLTAIAADSFTDVANTNTFHDDIGWLADAGITKGCNPPTNDQFCPNDSVSRGQMSAFMRRFAQYIGAEDGTPLNAVNATNAASAANADNADQLDGKAPSAYLGSVAGATINGVTPASGVPTVLATLNGFAVPSAGGALFVSADVGMSVGAPQLAILWTEVDGSGSCNGSLPESFTWHAFADVAASLSNSTTASVGNGNHRVDLCAVTSGGVSFGAGALTVQWVEDTQIGTVASSSTGRSAAEVLEELSSAEFGS